MWLRVRNLQQQIKHHTRESGRNPLWELFNFICKRKKKIFTELLIISGWEMRYDLKQGTFLY